MKKEEIKTNHAPAAIGPYSQAVRAGRFIFLSGQIPIEPSTGEIASGGAGAQTRQVLRNLQSVLEAAGGTLNNIVKTTVYLKDISNLQEMNSAYAEFFKAPYPARATIEAARLPKNVEIEIEAVAVVGEK